MIVTIFADASFDYPTKAAGWAGWAKSRRGKIDYSGKIRHVVSEADEAETCAIINMIAVAKKAGVCEPGDELLIQSDCVHAMRYLETGNPGKAIRSGDMVRRDRAKRRQRLISTFQRIAAGYKVRFKHVRAHQASDNPRSWVNNQCDKNARKHMMKEREARRSAAVPA